VTDLADLHERLERVRWAHEPDDAGWAHGVPLTFLQDAVEHWRLDFDWRAHEARLNALPQFTTEVDQAIHFLHVRSPEPDAVPLLLCHGRPGSVFGFLEIIGPLTDPRAHGGAASDAFHVVVPSMPGCGFSGPMYDGGWDAARIARALATLMERLGYHRYATHGGAVAPSVPTPRPLTLAHALADSPVGQLAWTLDGFAARGEDTDAIDVDAAVAEACLYWLTRTAGSAARTYCEDARCRADVADLRVRFAARR